MKSFIEAKGKFPIVLILCMSIVLSACSRSSKESKESVEGENLMTSDSQLAQDVTPIATKPAEQTSETFQGTIETNPTETTQNERIVDISNRAFADNFTVIDNSGGTVNVYEIDVALPLHTTRQWQEEHGKDESQLSFFEADHWTYAYDILFVRDWYFGSAFNCFAEEVSENGSTKDTPLIRYTPPEDTIRNTVAGMSVMTIGEIPDWESLPFDTSVGSIDPDQPILCFNFDGAVFPRNARYCPGKPAYFPEDCDVLHCVGIADKYIDNIPVCGDFNYMSCPRGVFEYGDLISHTKGSCLMHTQGIPYRNGDTILHFGRSGDFTIRSVVKEDIPLKPVTECLDAVAESLEYFNSPLPYLSMDTVQIYAAELAYLPLSEYDLDTYDYSESAKTYLVPVWNFYLYSETYNCCCSFCISIDATTGKALYSKEYALDDPRMEMPDEEMQ